MKRWLKKHSKKLVIILGLLFIANSIWGLTMAIPQDKDWAIVIHMVALMVWVITIFIVSGLAHRVFIWWNSD